MFSNAICSTPLTTSIADQALGRIYGSSLNADTSFVATLRALMYPRIKDTEDTIRLSLSTSTPNKAVMDRQTVNSYINYALDSFYPQETGRLYIHVFSRDGEENVRFMHEHFAEVFSGWSELEKVHDLFCKSFQSCCFINPERKSTILMVDGLDYSKWHYIQCATLGLLPWYFDKEQGCTDLEMRLIYSLRQKSSKDYMDCMREYAEMYNFRELNIRNSLKGIEHANDRRMIQEKEGEIESLNQRIISLQERISNALHDLNETNAVLAGYKLRIAESDEESPIMEYFLCNKNIDLVQTSGSVILFNVRGYLEYFDEDIAEQMIENRRSFVYTEYEHGDRVSSTDMAMLLKSIFIDHTLKIKVCAQYKLDVVGGVYGMSDAAFDGSYDDCMPNPHIQRYSCMGNFSRIINQLLSNGDSISAIDQCCVSAKSLNWADSCVMSEFMRSMYGRKYNNKCIELPDGSTVSPSKAVAYLKELNAEEE